MVSVKPTDVEREDCFSTVLFLRPALRMRLAGDLPIFSCLSGVGDAPVELASGQAGGSDSVEYEWTAEPDANCVPEEDMVLAAPREDGIGGSGGGCAEVPSESVDTADRDFVRLLALNTLFKFENDEESFRIPIFNRF
jgi:hypothetical protein